MKKLIVIADWAGNDLNRQEIRSAVGGFLKEGSHPYISFVSSDPSTIHTAFILSQIVETEERYGRPNETVIFQNTDPRIQTRESVKEAKGAEFIVIRLKSGIYLCGPNAGYDFSLIKDKIDEVYTYPGLDKGSQFRSRDLYSRVSAHLMDYMEDELDLEEASSDSISDLKGAYIFYIDNHGNVKTSLTGEHLKGKYEYGESVTIEVNGIKKKVKYVSNLFGGIPGELVIYPGSSGKKDNPYLEISVWRHFTEEDTTTGKDAFNNPRPGTTIQVK